MNSSLSRNLARIDKYNQLRQNFQLKQLNWKGYEKWLKLSYIVRLCLVVLLCSQSVVGSGRGQKGKAANSESRAHQGDTSRVERQQSERNSRSRRSSSSDRSAVGTEQGRHDRNGRPNPSDSARELGLREISRSQEAKERERRRQRARLSQLEQLPLQKTSQVSSLELSTGQASFIKHQPQTSTDYLAKYSVQEIQLQSGLQISAEYSKLYMNMIKEMARKSLNGPSFRLTIHMDILVHFINSVQRTGRLGEIAFVRMNIDGSLTGSATATSVMADLPAPTSILAMVQAFHQRQSSQIVGSLSSEKVHSLAKFIKQSANLQGDAQFQRHLKSLNELSLLRLQMATGLKLIRPDIETDPLRFMARETESHFVTQMKKNIDKKSTQTRLKVFELMQYIIERVKATRIQESRKSTVVGRDIFMELLPLYSDLYDILSVLNQQQFERLTTEHSNHLIQSPKQLLQVCLRVKSRYASELMTVSEQRKQLKAVLEYSVNIYDRLNAQIRMHCPTEIRSKAMQSDLMLFQIENLIGSAGFNKDKMQELVRKLTERISKWQAEGVEDSQFVKCGYMVHVDQIGPKTTPEGTLASPTPLETTPQFLPPSFRTLPAILSPHLLLLQLFVPTFKQKHNQELFRLSYIINALQKCEQSLRRDKFDYEEQLSYFRLQNMNFVASRLDKNNLNKVFLGTEFDGPNGNVMAQMLKKIEGRRKTIQRVRKSQISQQSKRRDQRDRRDVRRPKIPEESLQAKLTKKPIDKPTQPLITPSKPQSQFAADFYSLPTDTIPEKNIALVIDNWQKSTKIGDQIDSLKTQIPLINKLLRDYIYSKIYFIGEQASKLGEYRTYVFDRVAAQLIRRMEKVGAKPQAEQSQNQKLVQFNWQRLLKAISQERPKKKEQEQKKKKQEQTEKKQEQTEKKQQANELQKSKKQKDDQQLEVGTPSKKLITQQLKSYKNIFGSTYKSSQPQIQQAMKAFRRILKESDSNSLQQTSKEMDKLFLQLPSQSLKQLLDDSVFKVWYTNRRTESKKYGMEWFWEIKGQFANKLERQDTNMTPGQRNWLGDTLNIDMVRQLMLHQRYLIDLERGSRRSQLEGYLGGLYKSSQIVAFIQSEIKAVKTKIEAIRQQFKPFESFSKEQKQSEAVTANVQTTQIDLVIQLHNLVMKIIQVNSNGGLSKQSMVQLVSLYEQKLNKWAKMENLPQVGIKKQSYRIQGLRSKSSQTFQLYHNLLKYLRLTSVKSERASNYVQQLAIGYISELSQLYKVDVERRSISTTAIRANRSPVLIWKQLTSNSQSVIKSSSNNQTPKIGGQSTTQSQPLSIVMLYDLLQSVKYQPLIRNRLEPFEKLIDHLKVNLIRRTEQNQGVCKRARNLWRQRVREREKEVETELQSVHYKLVRAGRSQKQPTFKSMVLKDSIKDTYLSEETKQQLLQPFKLQSSTLKDRQQTASILGMYQIGIDELFMTDKLNNKDLLLKVVDYESQQCSKQAYLLADDMIRELKEELGHSKFQKLIRRQPTSQQVPKQYPSTLPGFVDIFNTPFTQSQFVPQPLISLMELYSHCFGQYSVPKVQFPTAMFQQLVTTHSIIQLIRYACQKPNQPQYRSMVKQILANPQLKGEIQSILLNSIQFKGIYNQNQNKNFIDNLFKHIKIVPTHMKIYFKVDGDDFKVFGLLEAVKRQQRIHSVDFETPWNRPYRVQGINIESVESNEKSVQGAMNIDKRGNGMGQKSNTNKQQSTIPYLSLIKNPLLHTTQQLTSSQYFMKYSSQLLVGLERLARRGQKGQQLSPSAQIRMNVLIREIMKLIK